MTENDFNSWFSGSKMVDRKTKQPNVYYHGTPQAGFTSFDPNKSVDGTFYFSPDQGVGDSYASSYSDTDNPAVYPVHLNIRKPLVYGKQVTPAAFGKILKIAGQFGVQLPPEEIEELQQIPYLTYGSILNRIKLASGQKNIEKQIVSALGYDGIQASGASVQAFNPNQIKSVFARNHDPNSTEIV
jgi:hypothetical protein